MDLITIPISFSHVCDSMSCFNQTNYLTLTDLDFLVIGINFVYGFFIVKFWKESKRRKQQRLTEVAQK